MKEFYFSNNIIKCTAFDKLEAKIGHGFSTRYGGVSSRDETKSMNLGFLRGDEDETVIKNMEIFNSYIGAGNCKNVIASQRHTLNVVSVDSRHAFDGKIDMTKFGLEGVDGFVTKEKDLVLTVRIADCVPILFADVQNGVIGAVHSGWRGTMGKIGKIAVDVMEKEGADRKSVVAAVGPCIGQCCFEVKEDFVSEFEKNAPELLEFINKSKDGNVYFADLKGMNRYILNEAGLREENVHISDLCTCCAPDMFFSHRATGGKRGTMGASIFLR